MSMLAIAISLLAGVGPVAIMPADLAMFSPVQAIIAADAGEKAQADSRVAMSSFFIGNLVKK
jgi:hypothetical protein